MNPLTQEPGSNIPRRGPDKMFWSPLEHLWICQICSIKTKKKAPHEKNACFPSWTSAWDPVTEGCRKCGMTGFKCENQFRFHVKQRCPLRIAALKKLADFQPGGPTRTMPARKAQGRKAKAKRRKAKATPTSIPEKNMADVGPGDGYSNIKEEICDEEKAEGRPDDPGDQEEICDEETNSSDEDSSSEEEHDGNAEDEEEEKQEDMEGNEEPCTWKTVKGPNPKKKKTEDKAYNKFLANLNRKKGPKDLAKLEWKDDENCWCCKICNVKKFSKAAMNKHSMKDCAKTGAQHHNPSWQLGWDRKTMSCRYCGMTGFKRRKNIRKHLQNKACPKLPDWDVVFDRTPASGVKTKAKAKRKALQRQSLLVLEEQKKNPPPADPNFPTLARLKHLKQATVTAAGGLGIPGSIPGTAGFYPNPMPGMGETLGQMQGPQWIQRPCAQPRVQGLATTHAQIPGPGSFTDQIRAPFGAPMPQSLPIGQRDNCTLQMPGRQADSSMLQMPGRQTDMSGKSYDMSVHVGVRLGGEVGHGDNALTGEPSWTGNTRGQAPYMAGDERGNDCAAPRHDPCWEGGVGDAQWQGIDARRHDPRWCERGGSPDLQMGKDFRSDLCERGNDRDAQWRNRDEKGNERDAHWRDRNERGIERDAQWHDRNEKGNERDAHWRDRNERGNDRDAHWRDRNERGNDRDALRHERDAQWRDRNERGNERVSQWRDRGERRNERDAQWGYSGNDRDAQWGNRGERGIDRDARWHDRNERGNDCDARLNDRDGQRRDQYRSGGLTGMNDDAGTRRRDSSYREARHWDDARGGGLYTGHGGGCGPRDRSPVRHREATDWGRHGSRHR